MRLRALLFAVLVFAAGGAAAWHVATAAVGWFERRTANEIAAGLAAAGQPWASVAVDGLTVTLRGEAPSETSRFRAIEVARQVTSEARVIDATTLRAVAPLAPPPFALELLRNEAEVSLIGLVPEAGGRDLIRAGLGAAGLDENVTDMLESAAEPAPAGWREALAYGLSVLGQVPRAKISVLPGEVAVTAVADSDPERAALEARLRRAAPSGVSVLLEIGAPRPVITPFAFAFSRGAGGAHLAACSAETDEAARRILAAARRSGLAGEADCAVGLGAPSPDWAEAVERGLEALDRLGGGQFSLRDLAAELTAAEGTPPETFAEVARALDERLPSVFQLTASVPPRMQPGADGAEVYAPRFDAKLGGDGRVELSGPVQNPASQAAIESFAAALFGHDRVVNATVVDPALPEGWPTRVLAGVEALAALKQGTLTVTPERVELAGESLEADAGAAVEALLAAKLGGAATVVDVAYDAAGAKAAELAARPRPEICAEEIDAILDAGSISFAPGSADIVPESRGVIAAIADVLHGCPGADFVVEGHTDSQGSTEANLRLSMDRAAAVVAALEAADLPLVHLTARGFGDASPVGDNATDSGRARNRRIEFTLAPPPGSPEAEAAAAAAAAAEAALDAAKATGATEAETACVAEIETILAETSLQFDAGSARLADDSQPVIDRIAAVLAGCPDARVEVGGHTDSQGSEDGNQRLSEARARAVLTALRSDALPLLGISARGYGESRPIADNGTDAGRAANRRIAFTLRETPPAAAATEPPAGSLADCLAGLEAVLAGSRIEFAAGSAEIAPESAGVVDALADVLRRCPDARLELAGHTDSQGSDAGNLRLSQERAEAVLAALRQDDLPLPGLVARGYGETRPVADNGTEAGRAANRRIAFTLPESAASGGEDGPE
jgi:OOP family OmpA-OmpF porin